MERTSIGGSLVYVADDEPANTKLLEAILERPGVARVRSFPDGRALLDAIEREEPDLILLDLRMPILDGYGVLTALHDRRAEEYIPILVLTANSDADSRSKALAGGANDYLTKPFDVGEVLLRVRNLLETRRLHLALRDRNANLVDQVATAARALGDREREWAEQATALSQLEALETAEATAQAICDEISAIPGLTTVIIVALDAAGDAVPLAINALDDVRIGVNRALPPALTARWRERVGEGTWVGPAESSLGLPRRGVSGDPSTAVAIVPLRTGKTILGALAAATASADGVAYLRARLPILESFGAVASALLAPGIQARQHQGALRWDLEEVLANGSFHPVFQPIVELRSGLVVGHEALTRFADGTRPDRRFADAAAVGLGFELEVATLSAALEASADLPADGWLSLNVSPGLLLEARRLRRVLRGHDRPLVLEVTEHVAIEDYAAFRTAAGTLGSRLRFAVDDAGAGYASFRHILELRPDFVKLDIGLVQRIDRDDVRQALVAGIVYFARRTGSLLIAEGIETAGERKQLEALGVDLGQGYLLGRPAPVGKSTGETAPTPATEPSSSTATPAATKTTAGVTGRRA